MSLKKLFKIISSMKVAILLLIIIIGLSMLATFIPQNRPEDFYNNTYPESVSTIIHALKLHRFYRSLFFLVPMASLFVNLLACTVMRITKRAGTGVKKRFGPDIIHISILLFMMTGVLSVFLTTSGEVVLTGGEDFTLPGGYRVKVDRLEQINYDDGRPKDWFTHVSVYKNSDLPLRKHAIEVNKPLQIGPYKIYQYTFYNNGEITVSDSQGNRGIMKPGEGFRSDSLVIIARSIETASTDDTENVNGEAGNVSVIFEIRANGKNSFLSLKEGDSILGFSLEEVVYHRETGLLVTYNPLFPLILGVLILFILGLGLTFIQKLGEKKP